MNMQRSWKDLPHLRPPPPPWAAAAPAPQLWLAITEIPWVAAAQSIVLLNRGAPDFSHGLASSQALPVPASGLRSRRQPRDSTNDLSELDRLFQPLDASELSRDHLGVVAGREYERDAVVL